MTVALNCDGFNLLQNNGETAGQTMFHFHMHLIPRYKDADNNMLKFTSVSFSDEEMDAIRDQIIKRLSGFANFLNYIIDDIV